MLPRYLPVPAWNFWKCRVVGFHFPNLNKRRLFSYFEVNVLSTAACRARAKVQTRVFSPIADLSNTLFVSTLSCFIQNTHVVFVNFIQQKKQLRTQIKTVFRTRLFPLLNAAFLFRNLINNWQLSQDAKISQETQNGFCQFCHVIMS